VKWSEDRPSKRGLTGVDMKRAAAIVQVIIMLLIVGYSTVMFFLGHFEQGLVMLPFMMAYYVFITARHQKRQSKTPKDGEEPAC
jgi:hypothetical protein